MPLCASYKTKCSCLFVLICIMLYSVHTFRVLSVWPITDISSQFLILLKFIPDFKKIFLPNLRFVFFNNLVRLIVLLLNARSKVNNRINENDLCAGTVVYILLFLFRYRNIKIFTKFHLKNETLFHFSVLNFFFVLIRLNYAHLQVLNFVFFF